MYDLKQNSLFQALRYLESSRRKNAPPFYDFCSLRHYLANLSPDRRKD